MNTIKKDQKKLNHGKFLKKEKNDEISQNIKKKENHKSILIKLKPKNKKNLKRNIIIMIIIIILFFIHIIRTTDLIIPTAPRITKGNNNWYKSKVVKVEKDSKTKYGIKYYQYCINKNKGIRNCKWNITKTKNVRVVKNGKYYVYFRAVDKKKRIGRVSNGSLTK